MQLKLQHGASGLLEEYKPFSFRCHNFARYNQPMTLILIAVGTGLLFMLRRNNDIQPSSYNNSASVVEIKPVPIQQFERELMKADNYRDVLRIFYGKHLSDSVVDEILAAEIPFDERSSHREHGFASDRRYDRIKDGDQAVKHLNEMKDSEFTRCQPRPKVIHMQDNLSVGTKIKFWPSCTVVYRCQQDSGCCGHDTSKLCLPKRVERVARSFFVTERVMGQLIRPRYESFTDTFNFENHTECECQYKVTHNKNKCSECPFPYMLTKGAPHCICDCDKDSIVCMEIKVGNRSFDEKPLQCIKEEKCQTPLCEYGNFDMRSVRSGYCPGKKKDISFQELQPQVPRSEFDKNSYFDISESGSGFGDMEDDDYEESNFIDYEP